MAFNIWTFLFQVLNFLVLVLILRWLLYRPLRQAIDQRRNANARAQGEAEAARKEAADLQQKLSAQMAGIDLERQELFRKTRAQAEAERNALMAQTELALKRRREEVERQLVQDRDEALRTLRAELVDSAVALAERLLQEAADSTLQRQLAGRLVDALQLIPEDLRRRLRDGWIPDDEAVIETPVAINSDILERIGGALESLAGRAVKLSVLTQPALLCGVRLRVGGHVWDASLAGALEEARSITQGGTAP
jgi:F-type H+-transporting ATPase subunit b